MKPGQDMIVTGYIGLEGTVLAVEKLEARLKKTLPQDLLDTARSFREYLKASPEAAVARQHGEIAMQEVRNGGIFAALWELAEAHKIGMTVYLKKIPVRQETIEITELFDIDPYRMDSKGAVLIGTFHGMELTERLNRAGIPAAVIGRVSKGPERILYNQEIKRYIEKSVKKEKEA